MNQNRKRLFAIFCVIIGLPVCVGFAITDYLEGDTLEFTIDVVLCIFIAASVIALLKYKIDLMVYRTGLTLVSLAHLFNVSIGAGNETGLYWVLAFPPMFFFFLRKLEGLMMTISFSIVLCVLLFTPALLGTHDYKISTGIRFFCSFLFATILAYGLEASRYRFSRLLSVKHDDLLREKRRLEAAVKEIKTLSGLLPICSHCKKIRDDGGYWNQIDDYITKHSDTQFSHSICPECAKILYPDLDIHVD